MSQNKTLAQLFTESKGEAVKLEGSTVHNIYKKKVLNGQAVNLRLSLNDERPFRQGVCIKIVDGLIVANGEKIKEAVIWTDTVPNDFRIICLCKGNKEGSTGELRVWNCWDRDGFLNAWVGNAGIIVEEYPMETILHCSPGVGEFNPKSLSIHLSF